MIDRDKLRWTCEIVYETLAATGYDDEQSCEAIALAIAEVFIEDDGDLDLMDLASRSVERFFECHCERSSLTIH